MIKFPILYEDNDILICEKPVGMDSQDNRGFSISLPDELRLYLSEQSSKKALPYLGILHRLDRPVGGLMVYAKTKRAAASMSKQISEHQLGKHYFSVICGVPPVSAQTLMDYLSFQRASNTSVVCKETEPGAKLAKLCYHKIATIKFENTPLTLLDVELMTGRHHQIRVQLSHAGYPLYGDQKYGGYRTLLYPNIGLFSYDLQFKHPFSGKQMHFRKLPDQGIFREFSDILRTYYNT